MKKYLIAGFLVWAPIAVTIWLITLVFGSINSLFRNLLLWLHQVFGINIPSILFQISSIPGVGVLTLVLIIWITGLFAANIAGKWWLDIWHKIINHIPIVKSIYSMTKQIFDTLLSDSGKSFKEAVLIEYPLEQTWTIAFVTGKPAIFVMPIDNPDKDWISVYVPTTPNPTSGFLLIVDRNKTKKLDISVEQALKYIVSMGVLNIDKNKIDKITKEGKP